MGFEEQSFEMTEMISARGFEKQANVSDLFGATNSSKKDPASKWTPIPKSSNSRIKSPSPAVRSLGSIDEESDVVIPTPKTTARFLQEGMLKDENGFTLPKTKWYQWIPASFGKKSTRIWTQGSWTRDHEGIYQNGPHAGICGYWRRTEEEEGYWGAKNNQRGPKVIKSPSMSYGCS